MNAFGHVISLLSFVYALAITHVLLTVAAIIRAWPRVKLSLPHALWLANAIIIVIANWISFYDMKDLPGWNMATIFFVFGIAFSNYLQAALVSPEIVPGETIDLQAFHAQQSTRYIGAFLASALIALVANVVLGAGLHVAEWNEQNLAVVPMVVIAIAAMALRGRRAQIALPVILMGVWVYYFANLQAALR